MSNKTGPCRALIAYGMGGTAIVLATDNHWLAEDIDNISDCGDDLGLTVDGNEKAGLFLFEGDGTWVTTTDPEGGKDGWLEWNGTERRVTMEELPSLLAMRSPDEEPKEREPIPEEYDFRTYE